jgi:hypothetical protein
MRISLLILFLIVSCIPALHAQETKSDPIRFEKSTLQFAVYDGAVVAGYVDHGAYLNFTGPNVSWSRNKTKVLLGMLPSLRFKEDNKEPKNSFVTPTLGLGLTCMYKKIVLQLPLYYNAKTATDNGKWNVGIGLGIRLKS